MENGVERGKAHNAGPAKARAEDALGAIVLAETRISERVLFSGVDGRRPAAREGDSPVLRARGPNAFGADVVIEQGDALPLAERMEALLADGVRAALVAPASQLARARAVLRTIARRRLPAVVHALAGEHDEHLDDALALADIGWGVLFASSVEGSLDMALVARRAAEDSGTPFVVVHEQGAHARLGAWTHHIEPVTPPSNELCEVFIGAPAGHLKKVSDPSHPIHADVSERAFAERVPFALGAAMRELESLTGRRHDAIERVPAMDAQLMLVGVGEIGESLVGAVERLRAHGVDVGAVKVTALRPFPGARLVKMLSRALAVSVVEGVDEPLAQSGPLTRELKAAFADALTWAPEYPGVGRIPRIVSGVVHATGDIEPEDVDAIVHNMLTGDDRSKRLFVLGEDPAHALERADVPWSRGADGVPRAGAAIARVFSMRGRVKDARTAEASAELCASVLHSALGLRARGAVRALGSSAAEGDGFAFDVLASRERPRGAHPPPGVRVVALEDTAALVHGNPLARLGDGGTLAVPTRQRSADGVWGELPPYAKAIVFDRAARVIGFAPPAASDVAPADAPWITAATFAGIALSALAPPGRPAVDASLVAREVSDALGAVLGPAHEALARRGGDAARAAFEASVEVPRATIERDEESVRLGRRDARAASAR